MPRVLLFVAVILTAARIIDIGLHARFRDVVQNSPENVVAWNVLPSLQKNDDFKKVSLPPPPEPASEFSKESLEELNKVLASGKAMEKYVLYEFYANWSDPCKTMENTSLSNGQVKTLIDEHFLPIRITDQFQETGKNPKIISELQKKYRVFAFPTLVIVDDNGKMVSTLVGNCNSLTTYRFLSRSLHSLKGRIPS
jgi:thiol:disulfide interchange protein